MASALRRLAWFLAFSILTTFPAPIYAWDSDLELFDLVEEINQNFYEFLSVLPDASGADIRKAYRRLSLTLHPDKNKDENAETQFRQLVAIYEVLKDEERRQRYNDILVNGLPDWRQPVFYYRRVRRMSNGELGFLLFLILTVGHYAVIWSIYLEKQLDELLSKKKKEKKKKLSTKTAEELKCSGQDRVERDQEKPHWQDILPLKLSIWLYMSIKSLPHVIQDVKQYYEDYKEMKMKEEEEAQAMAEQEATQKEKRPKVKKAKFEFPAYTASITDTDSGQFLPSYDQGTSIQEIEDQMDDWLDDCKPQKKKAPEWTEEDLSLLTRSMAKFPGGTPGRWEKIAHELGRSVTEVTAKAKQLKDCVTNSSGLVKLSELKGSSSAVKASRAAGGSVPDSLMTQRESPPPPNPEPSAGGAEPGGADPSDGAQALRRRSRKTGGEVGGEAKGKGRRQRDFDPTAAEEDSEEEHSPSPSAHQGTKEKSGDQGAKEKSGDQGSKEKSGDQASKEKSGDQGAKEKSGDQGAKEKSGDQGAKEKSGDQGAKEKSGDQASKERSGAADEVWTQNQQKLLELALQQYPRGTTERWDRIAKGVPGKSKEECMIRYKLLAELVQKRKQAKS